MCRAAVDTAQARAWLRQTLPQITFGDQASVPTVQLVAFTADGLRRLGVDDALLDTFPLAFRQGMAHPVRTRVLKDTGPDEPVHWLWGSGERVPDVAIFLYARNEADRQAIERDAAALLREYASARGLTIEPPDPSERIWPTKCPLGYRNVTGLDGKKVIAIDPKIAPLHRHHLAQPALYRLVRMERQADPRPARGTDPGRTFDLLAETTAIAVRSAANETAKSAKTEIWLPFLNTYRTMCLVPQPEFRQILEDVRELRLAA